MKCRSALLGTLLFAFSLFAQATLINFDDPGITNPVDNFYAGDGVIFQTGDWVITGGFGQTSQPNLAYSASGTGFMNVLAGFTGVFDFSYGAFSDSTLTIFDGLNGTGTILGSQILLTNDPNVFDFVSIGFSGTALSVAVVSGGGQFGWDDLEFSKGQEEVPVPATLPLIGLGLAALGYSRRKKAASAL